MFYFDFRQKKIRIKIYAEHIIYFNYRSFINLAAHSAFELPTSLRRNRNCRFKFDKSIVSISMTWILQKPISAKSLSNSQPKPPAPITKILHLFMIKSSLSNDGVNSGWQNGPDRSNILRMCVHRRPNGSDGGDDDTSITYVIVFFSLIFNKKYSRDLPIPQTENNSCERNQQQKKKPNDYTKSSTFQFVFHKHSARRQIISIQNIKCTFRKVLSTEHWYIFHVIYLILIWANRGFVFVSYFFASI